MSYLASLNT